MLRTQAFEEDAGPEVDHFVEAYATQTLFRVLEFRVIMPSFNDERITFLRFFAVVFRSVSLYVCIYIYIYTYLSLSVSLSLSLSRSPSRSLAYIYIYICICIYVYMYV